MFDCILGVCIMFVTCNVLAGFVRAAVLGVFGSSLVDFGYFGTGVGTVRGCFGARFVCRNC